MEEGCLEDEVLDDLIQGRLDEVSLQRVDRHIDSCASCRELVTLLARSVGAEEAPRTPGQQIGRYVLQEELGRGGFGSVWRAHDSRLQRDVALKLLRHAPQAGESEAWAEQLETEARAMAKLAHPHVVTVFDAGRVDDDEAFLAMELVLGETARSWLAQSPAADEVLDCLLPTAGALAAAHEAGLIHRDFKPENILIDAAGRARVTDFGLATGNVLPQGSARGELTESVVLPRLVGTPAYMAPEQLEGEPASAESDQFSFCVVLWEALTGARPFVAGGLEEQKARVLGAPAPGPRQAPPKLLSVLQRGLSVSRTERHANMADLLAALEAARRRPRRWPWVVAAVALTSLATAGAIAATGGESTPLAPTRVSCVGTATPVWDAHRRGQLTAQLASNAQRSSVLAHLDRWQREWSETQGAECHEAGAAQCLQRQRQQVETILELATSGELSRASGLVEALAALEPPRDCRGRSAVSEPVDTVLAQRGWTELDRARALRHTDKPTQARPLLDAAARLAADSKHDPLVAAARGELADFLRSQGELVAAEKEGLLALAAAQRSGSSWLEAQSWLQLASLSLAAGRLTEARQRCDHVANRLDKLQSPLLEVRLRTVLGGVLSEQKRFAAAERELERARALAEQHLPEAHLGNARVQTALGNLARARGDYAAARKHHLAAQALETKLLGAEHPARARHLHNLARVDLLQGNSEAAQQQYERALALERERLGDTSPAVARTHNSLGLLFASKSQPAEAERHYRAALTAAPKSSLEAATAQGNLGLLLLTQRRHEPALEAFERSLASLERLLGAGHPRVVARHLDIARALVGLSRTPEAKRSLLKAKTLAEGLDDAGLLERIQAVEKALSKPPTRPRRAPPAPVPMPQPGGSYMAAPNP